MKKTAQKKKNTETKFSCGWVDWCFRNNKNGKILSGARLCSMTAILRNQDP